MRGRTESYELKRELIGKHMEKHSSGAGRIEHTATYLFLGKTELRMMVLAVMKALVIAMFPMLPSYCILK